MRRAGLRMAAWRGRAQDPDVVWIIATARPKELDPGQRSHPDFTQELPRKVLPTRAKGAQSDDVTSANLRGVVCGASALVSL